MQPTTSHKYIMRKPRTIFGQPRRIRSAKALAHQVFAMEQVPIIESMLRRSLSPMEGICNRRIEEILEK